MGIIGVIVGHNAAKDKGTSVKAVRLLAFYGLLILPGFALGTLSCSNHESLRPQLETTYLLYGAPVYGVVVPSYVKALEAPRADAGVADIHRGGDILKIVSQSEAQENLGGTIAYWYKVESESKESWIFGTELLTFDLLIQAQNAARLIRQQEEK